MDDNVDTTPDAIEPAPGTPIAAPAAFPAVVSAAVELDDDELLLVGLKRLVKSNPCPIPRIIG
jgi:hypothetical protein